MKFGCMVLWIGWSLLVAPWVIAADKNNRIPAENPGNMGQRYYERYCSACHGMDGRGQGPVASVLQPPPR